MKASLLQVGDKCVLVETSTPDAGGVVLIVTAETSPFNDIVKGVYTRRLTDGSRLQLALDNEVIKVFF